MTLLIQQILVLVLVAACCLWLAFVVYRQIRPKPGQSPCGGNCCTPAPPPKSTPAPPPAQMISSDDLRARLKARKN